MRELGTEDFFSIAPIFLSSFHRANFSSAVAKVATAAPSPPSEEHRASASSGREVPEVAKYRLEPQPPVAVPPASAAGTASVAAASQAGGSDHHGQWRWEEVLAVGE